MKFVKIGCKIPKNNSCLLNCGLFPSSLHVRMWCTEVKPSSLHQRPSQNSGAIMLLCTLQIVLSSSLLDSEQVHNVLSPNFQLCKTAMDRWWWDVPHTCNVVVDAPRESSNTLSVCHKIFQQVHVALVCCPRMAVDSKGPSMFQQFPNLLAKWQDRSPFFPWLNLEWWQAVTHGSLFLTRFAPTPQGPRRK